MSRGMRIRFSRTSCTGSYLVERHIGRGMELTKLPSRLAALSWTVQLQRDKAASFSAGERLKPGSWSRESL